MMTLDEALARVAAYREAPPKTPLGEAAALACLLTTLRDLDGEGRVALLRHLSGAEVFDGRTDVWKRLEKLLDRRPTIRPLPAPSRQPPRFFPASGASRHLVSGRRQSRRQQRGHR